ncbi:ATP synthase F1 subunit gamma [Pseudothermotoga thermarum]|uniref:ATP synthase gamma chain n=1 Tax=Pseudothermotoga thermarum DSM 5069 TaxID=688269 RepID=F7YV84_9THEM|nr:ATP synthase F1 subunit gamma [Pseudothermotoga thermarum]AEH50383.1 ATP synthase F1, gamma subunit [Pseudothermotoga thermarum DSM 5069]
MSRGKLRAIKRKIQATTSLMKITKAMEMVARARIKKLEEGFRQAKNYIEGVEKVYRQIDFQFCNHPFVVGSGKKILVAIGSDMGLCGAFNAEMASQVEKVLNDYDGLITVGAKLGAHFSGSSKLIKAYQRMYEIPTFSFASLLTEELITLGGNVDVLYVKFINKLVQKPHLLKLTPLKTEGKVNRYEYEPMSEELAASFAKFYVVSKLFYLLYETKLSEMYSRQNAMRNATENAKEMIRKLTLEYNKARQASITQELIEIVTGAEALKEE